MLQRLGMGAGRGEMRIDRFRPGADADGQRLRQRAGRDGGAQQGGEGGEAESSRLS
jgi:hypothetical protein